MNKYKKLRKIRQAIIELELYGYKVTYYFLKKNYIEGFIKGIETNNVIYLDFEDTLRFLKE